MEGINFLYPFNSVFIVVAIGIVILCLLGKNKKNKILTAFKISYDQKYFLLGLISLIMGLVLIIIALMGPVQNDEVVDLNEPMLDIYVLLDTSKSMLTEDIAPSRIERSKVIIESILDSLGGDRIGFIPFASSSYIQMPLTDDYEMAKMFVEVIDTDMISGGGTNLSKAILLAEKSFKETNTSDKVIIILSDGEEHDSDTIDAANKIKSENLKIFSIGVGTTDGGLIPEYNQFGTKKIGYKKDSSGQVIMSKLNEDVLREAAKLTGGKYYRATPKMEEINSLVNDVNKLNREILETKQTKMYKHLYQYFLAGGIIFLLIGLVFAGRRLIYE